MAALTPKQKQELNIAIAGYLAANGFDAAYEELVKKLRDLGHIQEMPATNGCDSTILEKKWTTVVRLQRRVMELETQVKQLEADVKETGCTQSRQPGRRNLPKSPHLHQLAGHRSAISRVVFHPVMHTSDKKIAIIFKFMEMIEKILIGSCQRSGLVMKRI